MSRDLSEVLAARLFAQRTVVVRGVLDGPSATDAAAALMTLDASGDEPISLHLDCTSTDLDAALALVDTVDLVGVPVQATCIGRLEGPAVAVLAVAHHRLVSPHARIRLVEPASSFAGSAADVERFLHDHRRRLERFAQRLASATGRPVEHVEADLQSGRYLDAAEAVAYGLADAVLGSDVDGRGAGGRAPFGFQPPRPL